MYRVPFVISCLLHALLGVVAVVTTVKLPPRVEEEDLTIIEFVARESRAGESETALPPDSAAPEIEAPVPDLVEAPAPAEVATELSDLTELPARSAQLPESTTAPEPAEETGEPLPPEPPRWTALQLARRAGAKAPPPLAPAGAAARVLEAIAGENQPPDYPSLARRMRWQGLVVVRVEVGADGAVLAAEVVTSSGHRVLDRAALEGVRRWRFRGGPGVAEVPVEFVLRA